MGLLDYTTYDIPDICCGLHHCRYSKERRCSYCYAMCAGLWVSASARCTFNIIIANDVGPSPGQVQCSRSVRQRSQIYMIHQREGG